MQVCGEGYCSWEEQLFGKDDLDVFILRWMTCLIKKDTPFC